MARHTCERCGTALFTTTDPVGEHLCRDLRKRLERRQRQVDIILGIAPEISLEQAQLIAQKISGIISDED